jgi:hypothetical protein
MRSLNPVDRVLPRCQTMDRLPRRLWTARGLAAAVVIGCCSLTSVVHAQDVSERPLSIHVGVGAGYTSVPGYAGESSGGGWNGEAFVLVALRGLPVELHPTAFTYGRGATETVLAYAPCPVPGCTGGRTLFSGSERASGGTLDAVLRLSQGPLVPYLVGGLGAVGVSRQTSNVGTLHDGGFAYEYGLGLRANVGRAALFAEAKYFGTKASVDPLDGHSVHMIPVTFGFMF